MKFFRTYDDWHQQKIKYHADNSEDHARCMMGFVYVEGNVEKILLGIEKRRFRIDV